MKKPSNSMMLVTLLALLALPAAAEQQAGASRQAGAGQTGGAPANAPESSASQSQGMPQAGSETPIVAETTRETVSAKVVGIDKATRTLTLQAADGTKRDVKVSDRVKNFDQIKKGDTVTAQYLESTAVSLRKQAAGEPSVTTAPTVVQVAPQGEKPSGVVANTTMVTARIDKVDQQNRKVTLTGPKGNTITMHVDPSIPLNEVKKGDQVVVTYSQAIAVDVTPKG